MICHPVEGGDGADDDDGDEMTSTYGVPPATARPRNWSLSWFARCVVVLMMSRGLFCSAESGIALGSLTALQIDTVPF